MAKINFRQQIKRNNDMFDELITANYESVINTVKQVGEININTTPSKKLNAPTSLDVAANLWRWETHKMTPLIFSDDESRLTYSDSQHKASWLSLEDIDNKIGQVGVLFGALLAPYGVDLEIGHSQVSHSMVSKGLSVGAMNAQQNLIKLTSKIK